MGTSFGKFRLVRLQSFACLGMQHKNKISKASNLNERSGIVGYQISDCPSYGHLDLSYKEGFPLRNSPIFMKDAG